MGFRLHLSPLLLFLYYTSAALDFGPCDVVLLKFETCPEIPNPKIKFVVKQKRKTSTTFAYDVSIVNTIPIDNSLSSKVEVFEVTARGPRTNSTMTKEFSEFCKSTKSYMPEVFNTVAKAIKKASGESLYSCDLPPGSREAHDIIFDDNRSQIFPSVFWYRKYIAKIYLKKKREIVACNQITLQSVRKKH